MNFVHRISATYPELHIDPALIAQALVDTKELFTGMCARHVIGKLRVQHVQGMNFRDHLAHITLLLFYFFLRL